MLRPDSSGQKVFNLGFGLNPEVLITQTLLNISNMCSTRALPPAPCHPSLMGELPYNLSHVSDPMV